MIEVTALTKRYGNYTAVKELSFVIEDGHIYGFLGPNGAGKSTTMNIMTGCLAATSGTVIIDGNDIFENPVKAKRNIGYLPEQPPLYQDMTPLEYLRFVAEAKGIEKEKRKNAVEEAMEKTQITEVKNRLIKNLSKGYKQRVGIAQAILGNPSTIILDEPTVGLDPAQIIEIRSLIKELGKEHTIMLSSHILSEVQAVCDRIMIISRGSLVANDTPEGLERLFDGTEDLQLEIKGDIAAVTQVLDGIADASVASKRQISDITEVLLRFSPERDIAEEVFSAFAAAQLPILKMNTRHASLEDIFMELTGVDTEEEKSDDESGIEDMLDVIEADEPRTVAEAEADSENGDEEEEDI